MSEDVMIEATHGPYAGKRLSVSEADAKAAIKEGWAKDPYAPAPEPSDEPVEVKEVSAEDRQKLIDAANKAADRLRGVPAEDGDKDDKKTRAVEAEDSADYQTRSSAHKSKK